MRLANAFTGLLAKKAVEAGLQKTRPYIKTSLSPGSGVVTEYLAHSGVQPYLDQLGFSLTGYGCMTCIGNSGELPESVATAIQEGDLVAASVLSGNRNFEARIHPLTRASYLASPPLVVAYALAGSVLIDFETEPLGVGSAGQPVFLRDIWPSQEEIQQCIVENVMPEMFSSAYGKIKVGGAAVSFLTLCAVQGGVDRIICSGLVSLQKLLHFCLSLPWSCKSRCLDAKLCFCGVFYARNRIF